MGLFSHTEVRKRYHINLKIARLLNAGIKRVLMEKARSEILTDKVPPATTIIRPSRGWIPINFASYGPTVNYYTFNLAGYQDTL